MEKCFRKSFSEKMFKLNDKIKILEEKSFQNEQYNQYHHRRNLQIRGFHCRYPPLVRFFGKNKGGLSGQKLFVKVFLSKNISGASSRKKEVGVIWKGGVSTVKPSD
jgi:hypothetical protein